MRGAIATLLACAGCASPAPEPPLLFELSDRGVVALPALALERPPERDEARVAFALASGLSVTLQSVETAERLPRGEQRDPASVAAALATRLELGERAGELAASPCTVAGRPASCLSGWMERDGRRYARDGAVFALGDRVVWLDVSGAIERSAEVRDTAARVRAELEWRPA